MATNQVDENILSQIDSRGNHFLLLKDINGHHKYASAINRANRFLTIKPAKMNANNTTRGWNLQVDRKGGSSVLVYLVDMKHSNPVELSEYSVANKL